LGTIDLDLQKISLDDKEYLYVDGSGKKIPVDVDFNRQNYFVVSGVTEKRVIRDMSRMVPMTKEYHRLFQMNQSLITWMHTSLEKGIHFTYPAGNKLPSSFDPRRREWYKGAIRNDSLYISYPYIDASTKNPIITFSKSVFYPDGSFAECGSRTQARLPEV